MGKSERKKCPVQAGAMITIEACRSTFLGGFCKCECERKEKPKRAGEDRQGRLFD